MLGIDDSIQWTIVGGKKGKGTLTMRGADGEDVTYQIGELSGMRRITVQSLRVVICNASDHKQLALAIGSNITVIQYKIDEGLDLEDSRIRIFRTPNLGKSIWLLKQVAMIT